MTTIAFDIMGNDDGVKYAVIASMIFIKNNPKFKIIMVGDKNKIQKYLANDKRIKIIDVVKVADVNKGSMVFRDKDTSMYKAIKLVRDRQADAVLSSGTSAGYIAYATLMLKRLKGILRPAFMPIFPTTTVGKRFVVLDVGANLEVDGSILHSWARIGSIFAQVILKIKKPRVNILNVGIEDSKGLQHHKDASLLLAKDKVINYNGFIESRDLLNNITDVLVTDGYAGNIVLKTMEGTSKTISDELKKEMKKNPLRILGSLFSIGGFKALKNTLDFRNVGGAWVIGLDSIVIKAHGSSDIAAYTGALNQIKNAINNDVLNKIKKAIK